MLYTKFVFYRFRFTVPGILNAISIIKIQTSVPESTQYDQSHTFDVTSSINLEKNTYNGTVHSLI